MVLRDRDKGKVCNTAVRLAMLYGMKTVAPTGRQDAGRQDTGRQVVELRMPRFVLGITRFDKIRNKYIGGTARVVRIGKQMQKNRLCGIDKEYVVSRAMKMALPRRRKKARPKKRYLDILI